MDQRLQPTAFGGATAVISALVMLLLGIVANLGIYRGAADMMVEWHMFFSLTAGGIVGGIIEAAVLSFVFGWAFASCYNYCLRLVGSG